MRYDELRRHVREHFSDLLRRVEDEVSEAGPLDPFRLSHITAAHGLAEADAEDWAGLVHAEGASGLLRAFCVLRGIPEDDLTPANRGLLLDVLRDGHRAYAAVALDHNASLSAFDLRDNAPLVVREEPAAPAPAAPYRDVLREYFREVERPGALAVKSLSDKRTALDLLGEITGDKPLALLTKADARQVKDVLGRLPKNRSKSAKTRGKPVADILDLPGVERISSRTVNAYIGQLSGLMEWAAANGHAAENVFAGTKLRGTKRDSSNKREAFNTDHLQLIFQHLTENPAGLVSKETHKWGTLIGMFTGMRLNEVAQLETGDIKCVSDLWCIDVTEDGDDQKRLKTAAAQRRVPVHNKLVALGLLDFIEDRRSSAQTRLFPDLSYTAANGYGRNLGRWVNEAFLPALGIKQRQLVYHSFRHTMATRLLQAGADDTKVKAILGHEQSGVTHMSYFKEGFLPSQLKATLDLFSF